MNGCGSAYGRDMNTRLSPPNFTHPQLKIVWAAINTLEPDEMLELELELRTRLGKGDLPTSRTKSRRADALAALREVAALLGRSPSIKEYEQIRADQSELELPASSSIRTRLGGGWNDCLERAQLKLLPDGDVPVARTTLFTEAHAIEALQACRQDLGETPGVFSYRAWAVRPDVRARPGSRPLTEGPFKRLFGSFPAALRAAGLAGEAIRRSDGRVDPTEWSYLNEELLAALRLVHDRLGFSPSVAEYVDERRRHQVDSRTSGDPTTLPTPGTITRRFRFWGAALEAAGLPPRRPRKGARPGPQAPRYSDDEIIAALREAYSALGEPFTFHAYSAWRDKQRAERKPGWELLPSAWTASDRLRGWNGAVASMHAATKAAAPGNDQSTR